MASKEAWSRVGSMLEITYGKMLTGDKKRALYQRLDRLEDNVIIDAIGRHLDTPDVGKWPPTPADVYVHVEQIQKEAQAERSKRLEATKYALESARDNPEGGKAQRIPDALKGHLDQPAVILKPAQCNRCIDSGFVNYYLPKDQTDASAKYEVYTADEYRDLAEEIQGALKRYSAICRCEAGEYRQDKYSALLKGIEDQGRIRRGFVLVAEAEAMARKRRQREAEHIGAASV